MLELRAGGGRQGQEAKEEGRGGSSPILTFSLPLSVTCPLSFFQIIPLRSCPAAELLGTHQDLLEYSTAKSSSLSSLEPELSG